MYELVTNRVLRDLRNDPAEASGTSTLNKHTTILLILNGVEESNIRLIASVAPSVLANVLLVDLVPGKEVPMNSHMAPNVRIEPARPGQLSDQCRNDAGSACMNC
jgi:hypothetical protein